MDLKQKFLEFLRFSLVSGVIGNVVYYTTFLLLIKLGLWYLFSAIIASVLNTAVKFLLHKFWAFKDQDTEVIAKQLKLYIVVSIGFFFMNTGLLYLLVEFVEMEPLKAQIAVTLILAFASFVLTKKIFAKN